MRGVGAVVSLPTSNPARPNDERQPCCCGTVASPSAYFSARGLHASRYPSGESLEGAYHRLSREVAVTAVDHCALEQIGGATSTGGQACQRGFVEKRHEWIPGVVPRHYWNLKIPSGQIVSIQIILRVRRDVVPCYTDVRCRDHRANHWLERRNGESQRANAIGDASVVIWRMAMSSIDNVRRTEQLVVERRDQRSHQSLKGRARRIA